MSRGRNNGGTGKNVEDWTIRKSSGCIDVRGLVPTPYLSGPVWCPQTEAGTFIARRGPSIFVTGNSYDGTSVRGAAKVLTLTGHISEYRWAFDLDTAVNHVLEYGPLVVGTNWYSNMSEPDKKGLIDASGIFEGGHAYLIYAVNTKKKRAKLRNSWGIEWGIKGNAEISFDCLAKLIAEDGEACTAMESQVAA